MGNVVKDGTHQSFNEVNHHHHLAETEKKSQKNSSSSEPGQKVTMDDISASEPNKSWQIDNAKEVFHAGNELFKAHKFEEARSKYAEAILALQEIPSSSRSKGAHDNHVVGLSNLGVIEFAEGRYEEAKKLMQEALRRRREVHKQHDDAEQQQPNISGLYFSLKKDREYHRRASVDLSLDASHLVEHSTVDGLTAELLHNLAACHQKTGDLETALQLYTECLQLRKIVFGERSLKTADAFHCIATVQDKQENFDAAVESLRAALVIEEEVNGTDSLDNAMTMNNLGVLYVHAGRYTEALEYLRHALLLRQKHLGAEHQLSALTERNIRYAVQQQQQEQEPQEPEKEQDMDADREAK